MLREEADKAMRSMKTGKSPGVDNVPSELLKSGGEATTTVLTAICQKIWEMKECLKDWTQLLIIPLPKKGNLKQCQNYHTISLISHPSEIMLRVILSQLKAKAEDLLTEEQAGLYQARTQQNSSSIVESLQRSTYNTSAICSTTS